MSFATLSRQCHAPTHIDLRDRAILALLTITGIRVAALVSLKLKHFDRSRMMIIQDSSEVDTKFGKWINTYLIPFDSEIEAIFLAYVDYLIVNGFDGEMPLFPATAISQDEEMCFVQQGLSKTHWQKTSSVCKIVKNAFLDQGLPVYTPHSFRNTIVAEIYDRDLSLPAIKAVSQNLGHSKMMTTVMSYSNISLHEQGRLIREKLGQPVDAEFLKKLKLLLGR